jgi:hypothetical protein
MRLLDKISRGVIRGLAEFSEAIGREDATACRRNEERAA